MDANYVGIEGEISSCAGPPAHKRGERHTTRRSDRSLLADLEQLDLEGQRGVGRDRTAGTGVTVTEVRRQR